MSEFDDARRAALMTDLVRFLRNQPVDLLPFDAVRERLRLRHIVDRGTRDVPLDRIVGSLGREREFNRVFLPRDESLRDRWEEVHEIAEGPVGFGSVELYRVGEAYFVLDGHHRISVARSLGATDIEAHVREFVTDTSVQPDDSIEEVILRQGRREFLETTGLEAADDEYVLTEVDGYERLLDHISVHRYYRGLDLRRDFSWREAVDSWRDTVYRPMIALIRESGVLAQFAGRTETDLYLFAMDHLHYLRERYGDVGPQRAVHELQRSQRFSARLRRFIRLLRTKEGAT